jgi:hypothetical protein
MLELGIIVPSQRHKTHWGNLLGYYQDRVLPKVLGVMLVRDKHQRASHVSRGIVENELQL